MKKKTTEEFIQEAIKIHGNKEYNYKKTNYINKRTKVKIYCNKCKTYFYQSPEQHLRGQGCPICGIKKAHLTARRNKQILLNRNTEDKINLKFKSTEEFILKAHLVHGNKFNYIKTKYTNWNNKVEIICNTCHNHFLQLPYKHLHGSGCPICSHATKYNTITFIKKAIQKNGLNIFDYAKTKYINWNVKIEIICKKCGRSFWQLPTNHLSGQGCPYCSKSHGEDKIQYLLNQNNINYEIQKRFKDCKDKKPLPFDFYLPDLNICIEYQGEQHYRSGFSFFKCKYKDKAEEAYISLKIHDKIKKKYCQEHNIKLLEIKYCDNIEKKLNKIIKSKI